MRRFNGLPGLAYVVHLDRLDLVLVRPINMRRDLSPGGKLSHVAPDRSRGLILSANRTKSGVIPITTLFGEGCCNKRFPFILSFHGHLSQLV